MHFVAIPLLALSVVSLYFQLSPGPFPLVSDNVAITLLIFLLCLLPFALTIYVIFRGADWLAKRWPSRIVKGAVNTLGLSLSLIVIIATFLFGKMSIIDKEFLRHPSDDEVRYGDETMTPNGRIYFWVLHDTGALGYSGVGGFYEEKIMPGIYWRRMLCSKYEGGEFGLRLLDDKHVECNVLGTKTTHELY